MKFFFVMAALIGTTTAAFAQANTSLSNLTNPTSVNQSLIPSANNSIDLGSSTLGWKSIYLKGSVYIAGDKFIDDPISGGHNTAIGLDVLYSDASGGIDNTGVGFQALYNNTTGSTNTALGKWALFSNKTGFDNTASGDGALSSTTTGNYNTATGSAALISNISGQFNTASGAYSLDFCTASYNTACGSGQETGSGGNVKTGSNNTFLGFNANCGSSGTLDNSTVIGADALVTSSNTIRIGDTNITSIGGYANWSNVSDGRVKKNVIENVPGLAFIRLLKPITYGYNFDSTDKSRDGKKDIIYSGFIAQDAEAAAEKIGYNFSGIDKLKNEDSIFGLRYAEFIVPLVKAVQELAKQKEGMEAENNALEIENNDLDKRITTLENELSGISNK